MNAEHDQASASHVESSGFDVLSDVLRSVRLSASMLFLVEASRPWCSWAPQAERFRPLVLPRSQHMVSYHVVTRGTCWGGLRDREPEHFATGDVLVVPHGDAYFLADPPTAAPGYGPQEALEFFRLMAAGQLPSTVSEGAGGSGVSTQFICGFLGCELRPFNPVLAALGPMLHLRAAPANDRMRHLIDFTLCALNEPRRSGSDSVLLRLAELMFVEVLRRHLEAMPDARSGWLGGLRDPLVARALARVHAAPAEAWTLESLAAAVGTSRSVLAERFAHYVGEPPMHYLARWRMQLASQLLQQAGMKVVSVAAAVGYASEAAFSRAFKGSTGSTPADWRDRGSGAIA